MLILSGIAKRARVVELADSLASGASARKGVRVQVPPRAPVNVKPAVLETAGFFLFSPVFSRGFSRRHGLVVSSFLGSGVFARSAGGKAESAGASVACNDAAGVRDHDFAETFVQNILFYSRKQFHRKSLNIEQNKHLPIGAAIVDKIIQILVPDHGSSCRDTSLSQQGDRP